MIAAVARHLGPLNDSVVFLGGATVSLFLDPLAPQVRATTDVDLIIEVASRVQYYRFAEQLRALRFREDTEANTLCRWIVDGITVDVMPTAESILGFSNRWYKAAMLTALVMAIEPDLTIRLVHPAYFVATKIDAFMGRGRGDYFSRDMEDLIALLDGRGVLEDEIQAVPPDLRSYIAEHFGAWLQDQDFLNDFAGNLPPDRASQARAALVLERMTRLAATFSG